MHCRSYLELCSWLPSATVHWSSLADIAKDLRTIHVELPLPLLLLLLLLPHGSGAAADDGLVTYYPRATARSRSCRAPHQYPLTARSRPLLPTHYWPLMRYRIIVVAILVIRLWRLWCGLEGHDHLVREAAQYTVLATTAAR